MRLELVFPLSFLALLLPLPAMAQNAAQCWLPYAGFEARIVPENTSPPRFVTMLTTPPEKRPYSAEMPDVRTCTSSGRSTWARCAPGAPESCS